jgi:hypothetical protein
MVKWTRIGTGLVLALVLAPLAGCGGNADRDDKDAAAKAIDGTFAGEVSGTSAFVAVVASPAAGKQDRRAVTVYLSDGRRLSERLSGSVSRNNFVATTDNRDVEAKGKLSGNAVTGTVTLRNGKTVRYKAGRATAAAGLYDLTVSSDGELSGASAAGVALKGRSTLPKPGSGTLKLADGTRLKFEITRSSTSDPGRLRDGRVRLIVLPDGQLRGAGERRSNADGGDPDFFIRSSSS